MRRIPTLALFLAFLITGALAYAVSSHPERVGLPKATSPDSAVIYIVPTLVGLSAVLACLVVWRWRYGFTALISICLGVMLVGVGAVGYFHHQKLSDHGVRAEAEVTKRHEEITSHYAEGVIYTGKTTRYTVDYSYKVDGQEYPNRYWPVSEETWNRAATDVTLPIRYLPEDPTIHEIDLPAEQDNPEALPLIGLVICGVSVGFAWIVWNRRPRAVRPLPSSGRPVKFARR
jgi:hypothetical protein